VSLRAPNSGLAQAYPQRRHWAEILVDPLMREPKRRPAGPPSVRVVRSDCASGSCTVECREDEVLVTAYCGPKRTPALFLKEGSASCAVRPIPAPGLDISTSLSVVVVNLSYSPSVNLDVDQERALVR